MRAASMASGAWTCGGTANANRVHAVKERAESVSAVAPGGRERRGGRRVAAQTAASSAPGVLARAGAA